MIFFCRAKRIIRTIVILDVLFRVAPVVTMLKSLIQMVRHGLDDSAVKQFHLKLSGQNKNATRDYVRRTFLTRFQFNFLVRKIVFIYIFIQMPRRTKKVSS